MLLYPHERGQFDRLAASTGADLCAQYGPEHLLRLLSRMPWLLTHTALGPRPLETSVRCIEDLLHFLELNAAQLFPRGAYTGGGDEPAT